MRLAVQGAWVAENLKHLGSGAFYHLAYPTRQVDPELMDKLRGGQVRYGRVEIYMVRDDKGFQIADGELVAVHWFPEFIRIHFMIVKVYVDSMGKKVDWPNAEHFVTPYDPRSS